MCIIPTCCGAKPVGIISRDPPSIEGRTCPIHNGTLKTLFWSYTWLEKDFKCTVVNLTCKHAQFNYFTWLTRNTSKQIEY